MKQSLRMRHRCPTTLLSMYLSSTENCSCAQTSIRSNENQFVCVHFARIVLRVDGIVRAHSWLLCLFFFWSLIQRACFWFVCVCVCVSLYIHSANENVNNNKARWRERARVITLCECVCSGLCSASWRCERERERECECKTLVFLCGQQ